MTESPRRVAILGMGSVGRSGRPIDVAETVMRLVSAVATDQNANILRVCGQSLMGA